MPTPDDMMKMSPEAFRPAQSYFQDMVAPRGGGDAALLEAILSELKALNAKLDRRWLQSELAALGITQCKPD